MGPLKLLLIPLFLYLAILVAVWAMQARILFPASAVPPAGPLPRGAERLRLEIAEGVTLHGVHIPPSRPDGSMPVLLGFGGNAWNAEETAAYLAQVHPGADIVAFHYRGYAPSGGAPSAAALLADAPAAYDLIASRFPGRPIVAVGFSVGSGVAAGLARHRPLAGLILVTPFDSMERVAAGHFRWLPVRWLFRHDMPAARWLRDSTVPVALIAAAGDTLVPPARTEALRRQVRNLVFDRVIDDVDHNSIYGASAFQQAMDEALDRVVDRSRPAKSIGAGGQDGRSAPRE